MDLPLVPPGCRRKWSLIHSPCLEASRLGEAVFMDGEADVSSYFRLTFTGLSHTAEHRRKPSGQKSGLLIGSSQQCCSIPALANRPASFSRGCYLVPPEGPGMGCGDGCLDFWLGPPPREERPWVLLPLGLSLALRTAGSSSWQPVEKREGWAGLLLSRPFIT